MNTDKVRETAKQLDHIWRNLHVDDDARDVIIQTLLDLVRPLASEVDRLREERRRSIAQARTLAAQLLFNGHRDAARWMKQLASAMEEEQNEQQAV